MPGKQEQTLRASWSQTQHCHLLLPSGLRMSLNLYEPQFPHLWIGDDNDPHECCKETRLEYDTQQLIDKAASLATCLRRHLRTRAPCR